MKCFICGRDRHCVQHHVSYNPERTVPVCKSCHWKIHNAPWKIPEDKLSKMDQFNPKLKEADFRNRRKKRLKKYVKGEGHKLDKHKLQEMREKNLEKYKED